MTTKIWRKMHRAYNKRIIAAAKEQYDYEAMNRAVDYMVESLLRSSLVRGSLTLDPSEYTIDTTPSTPLLHGATNPEKEDQ